MKLVTLSGGIESAVALAAVVSQYGAAHVRCLSFDYGAKQNAREESARQALCSHYGVSRTRITLGFINDLFTSDLLLSGGVLPEGTHEDKGVSRAAVVPFRNGIFFSIALAVADEWGCDAVWVGARYSPGSPFKDTTHEFLSALRAAGQIGTEHAVNLVAPFQGMTKAAVVAYGANLAVPFHLTYSCYNGRDLHCGRCSTCRGRQSAFQASLVPDPTRYEDRS